MNKIGIAAEFLGTLLLVLSILASGGNALFIGLTLSLAIFFTGKISGGHINPAVSVAMYVRGRLSAEELAGYVLAQCLGGVSSVYLFKALA